MSLSTTERMVIRLVSNPIFSTPIDDLTIYDWQEIIEEAERQVVLSLLSASELIPPEY